MSKIIVNKEKLKDYIKKGISTALVFATIASFSGCSDTDTKEEIDTTTSVTTQADDENTNRIEVYDFIADDLSETKPEVTEVYDWSNTESIIRETKDEFAMLITDDNHRENNGISANKYSVVVFENDQEFGQEYLRIVDSEGNYYNNTRYYTYLTPNENTLVLTSSSPYSDKERYTVFNRITGEEKSITADLLMPAGKYIYKQNYETSVDSFDYTYELLNADGTPATNEIYDDLNYDYNTNYLYLTKDGKTEIVDTINDKARKIDGEVIQSRNGYLVIRTNTEKQEQYGAFKLTDINLELEEVIPYAKYDYISILSINSENTLFECSTYEENHNITKALLTATGETFISDSHDYYMRNFNGDNTITGIDIYHFGDSKPIRFFTIYNEDGEAILKDQANNYVELIPDTTLAIIQINEDDKYGIVNYKDGAIIYEKEPKYDRIYLEPIFDSNGEEIIDTYIIARNESAKQTDIYTKDLEQISKTDCGLLKAEQIAVDHHLSKVNSKKAIKQSN